MSHDVFEIITVRLDYGHMESALPNTGLCGPSLLIYAVAVIQRLASRVLYILRQFCRGSDAVDEPQAKICLVPESKKIYCIPSM